MSIVLVGSTSGSVTLQEPAIAGSTVINLPSVSMNIGQGGGEIATNTAFGASALAANTSGTRNTAVGGFALIANTTGTNTALGYVSLYSNTTGTNNVAVGHNDGTNVAALQSNTTGSSNSALGAGALGNNTTAGNNTAVGYQAAYNNSTGDYLTVMGRQAGFSSTTAKYNTFIGASAGYDITTGSYNTFIGSLNSANTRGAGTAMTTGSNNTILGNYSGNYGGLDIRTASNYIVLSDGDGNPRFSYISADSNWRIPYLGRTNTNRGGNTILSLNAGALAYDGSIQITDAVANNVWWGLLNGAAYVMTNTNGVQLTSGATAWASVSDSRLKNVTGTYTNALTDIAQIEAVKFTWKSDEQASPQVGVIAQSVQGVVPEAISTTVENGQEYLSVRYTELIPLMIASIQELKAEFDAYKASHP